MDIFTNTYKYDPNYHLFADLVGVDKNDRDDFKTAQKLSALFEWASNQKKTEDVRDVAEEVHSLRRELGVNFMGKSLVDFLYQRVRINLDKKNEIEKQKQETDKREENLKQEKELRSEGKQWRKNQESTKREIEQKSTETDQKLDQVVKEHRSKDKPKPVDKIKEVGLVDHTPVNVG